MSLPAAWKGAWKPNPTTWDNGYFDTLFGYEWELTKSPAGAHQWRPKDGAGRDTVVDAHDPAKRHAPMMSTADMALRVDPAYEAISRALSRQPATVRRRLRACMVQADPTATWARLRVISDRWCRRKN